MGVLRGGHLLTSEAPLQARVQGAPAFGVEVEMIGGRTFGPKSIACGKLIFGERFVPVLGLEVELIGGRRPPVASSKPEQNVVAVFNLQNLGLRVQDREPEQNLVAVLDFWGLGFRVQGRELEQNVVAVFDLWDLEFMVQDREQNRM